MNTLRGSSAIDQAAAQLRELVRASEPGALLGSEDALVARLGVSRATVRQVARLLEREGVLKVRRGINGGYFASRPDLRSIESAVCSYLELLDTDVKEATLVGAALWVEAVKKAATLGTGQVRLVARSLQDKFAQLHDDASFDTVYQLERESREAIFGLIESRYVELIFRINALFAERRYPTNPHLLDGSDYHRRFVELWRNAKLMELAAIAAGDEELALLAARHSRKLWYQRVWGQEVLAASAAQRV
jgi:DNA-binding GntR family transcriptional regulator